MLLAIKAILTVCIVWILYMLVRLLSLYQYRQYRLACLRKLPGRRWHNFLGVLSEFPDTGESGLAFLRDMMKTYPRLCYWYFGPMNMQVTVYHPDTVRAILKTAEPKPVVDGFYNGMLPWLGEGLLTAGGEKWARHRRLLTPAFHFDILKPYIDVNNRASDVLVSKLDDFAKAGEYFEVFSSVSLCTLEIMLKCALSYPDDVQKVGDSHPYVKAVNSLGSILMIRAFNPLIHMPLIFYSTKIGRKFKKYCRFVHDVASNVIQRRKKELDSNQNITQKVGRARRMLDFLDILLTAKDEAGKGLEHQDIRDEVDTFLFEGHDTTSSAISWMLYSMAEHPEWQTECQKEIDEILQKRDSDHILWEDLSKFRVLTACLKEALRLHAPVPLIERENTKDIYIDGYFIPRGCTIDINLYGLMHNENVWDNPMAYKPERFLDEDDNKDSFAFLPFSAGPRNCIGQHFAMHEMKCVVARVLRRFRLELDPARPAKHKISLVMRTEDGMYLKATPRNGH